MRERVRFQDFYRTPDARMRMVPPHRRYLTYLPATRPHLYIVELPACFEPQWCERRRFLSTTISFIPLNESRATSVPGFKQRRLVAFVPWVCRRLKCF